MKSKIASFFYTIEQHTFLVMLFLCFFIFTFMGIGIPAIVAFMGLVLSISGLIEGEVKTDRVMLTAIIAGVILCGISSVKTFGNIYEGYTCLFAIYPVIYMVSSYLDEEEGAMLRNLCVLWGEIIAGFGLLGFVYGNFKVSAYRLGGIIGNPNALGIFLALIWLMTLRNKNEEKNVLYKISKTLEPVILVTITLTLSMGSFLALATGIVVYMYQEKKMDFPLMAEMSIYAGTGLLVFLAAMSEYEIFMILPVIYTVVLCFNRRDLREFLENHIKCSSFVTCAGCLGGFAAVMLRPSAVVTFGERISMMKNGIGYFLANPLTGVGSYQWRLLNFYDDDKYFGTWHIHNIPLHFAVELGIFAALIIIFIFLYAFFKKGNKDERPAIVAFSLHNLIDTSFFYPSITSPLIIANIHHTGKEKSLGKIGTRIIYGIFTVYFVFGILFSLGIIR